MKDARFLIRLSNSQSYQPAGHEALLMEARDLAAPLKGKVINLRVSPKALEFDLFCPPGAPLASFFEAWKPLGNQLTCKRLDVPPPPMDAAALVTEARGLFNEHRFWEVHEVLEGLWKARSGPEKQLVQGLILAAAALVHAQKNENRVAWAMLEDALERLKNQPADYYGWNVDAFRKSLYEVIARREITALTV